MKVYLSVFLCMYMYIYKKGHPPPKIYTCMSHTISCLFAHTYTLVISTETTINIGVLRCCPRTHTTLLLNILFQYIDKSAAEFRPTNLTLYVLGKRKLSEGTRVHLLWYSKTSCFFAFFGRGRTVTVHQSRALCISFGE